MKALGILEKERRKSDLIGKRIAIAVAGPEGRTIRV